MKEIKNWKATFVDDMGQEGIGILLPGCFVKGIVTIAGAEENIEINVLDVDISDLVITSVEGERYKLTNVSREYLQDIKKCIEIGLKERDGEEI